MAGRYVILEFDDKGGGEQFIRDEIVEQYGGNAVAMFLKPSQFCSCPDKTRQNNKNWRKNRKFGLYVCLKCNKPSIHHERGILERLRYVFGYNILEDR